MNVYRVDTVIKVTRQDHTKMLRDWRGIAFWPRQITVQRWSDGRVRVHVKGQGRSAMFKINGETMYRPCPTWLQELIVKAGAL